MKGDIRKYIDQRMLRIANLKQQPETKEGDRQFLRLQTTLMR